jgi:hypothetical protein
MLNDDSAAPEKFSNGSWIFFKVNLNLFPILHVQKKKKVSAAR